MSYLYQQAGQGRWIPPWLRHQNSARYEWAAGWATGRRVVEIGCGAGDGTRQLRDAGARQVDGYDVSAPAVEAARQRHQNGVLRFAVASAVALPVEDDAYDLAVSLETIEHLPDDAAFVREVRRVLRPGGTFLCSTPNRLLTNPGTEISDRPFNPHHVREYTAEELAALLGDVFASVDILGQTAYPERYSHALGVLGRRLPRLAVRLHQMRKLAGAPFDSIGRHRPSTIPPGGQPEVLIAVCR